MVCRERELFVGQHGHAWSGFWPRGDGVTDFALRWSVFTLWREREEECTVHHVCNR
jgi:hypothetical protein